MVSLFYFSLEHFSCRSFMRPPPPSPVPVPPHQELCSLKYLYIHLFVNMFESPYWFQSAASGPLSLRSRAHTLQHRILYILFHLWQLLSAVISL